MRGQHLDDLHLFAAPFGFHVSGGSKVASLSLPGRKPVVSHLPHEILQEAVVSSLRRAGIGLDPKDLLARERSEYWFQSLFGKTGQRRKPRLGESLSQYRRVLKDRALPWIESVESCSDQRVEGFRDLQLLDFSGQPVGGPFLGQE